MTRRLYCPDMDPAYRRLALDVAGGPALPPTLIQALPRLAPEAVHAMRYAATALR